MSLGFIGAGRMARALAQGFIRSKVLSGDKIIASSPKMTSVNLGMMKDLGVNVTTDNRHVVRESPLVFLAVKPHVVPQVLEEISADVTSDTLVVSVAAGVTLQRLQDSLPPSSRVIRVMPNTPSQLLEGCSVFTLGECANEVDRQNVHRLMSAVGNCEEVKENLIEAVLGMSSSGVAFFFVALEAVADGGVKMGIPRSTAYDIAAQTMLGAARMVKDTKKHPAVCKDEVCSPGGCTMAGIHQLEKGGFRGSLIDAVEAAALTAQKIGRK